MLFPRRGAETLIAQLVGFGTERHDDLADALVILLLKAMEQPKDVTPLLIKGKQAFFYRR